jgi:hypothetical protein
MESNLEKPDGRFYVAEDGNACLVYNEEMLAAAGLDDDAKAKEVLGESGHWVEIYLHRPNGAHPRQIAQLCRVPDDERGWRFDADLEPAARLQVMVRSANGLACAPKMEEYSSIDLPLASAIDALILRTMYPNAAAHPDFLAAWRLRQKASDEKSP